MQYPASTHDATRARELESDLHDRERANAMLVTIVGLFAIALLAGAAALFAAA